MRLNTDYLKALELVVPIEGAVNLVLVGCGGNGSWLAPTVARVARLLIEAKGKDVRTFFVDPDEVEEKNVYRQNFCTAEVGLSKAETLANRYGTAWGVDIFAIPKEIGPDIISTRSRDTTIYIGCVDGPKARIEISKMVRRRYSERIYWLDTGNRKTTGQVLLGGNDQAKKAFPLEGICARLPLPSTQHPELVDKEYDSMAEEAEAMPACTSMSCADLALQGSQGLSVNQTVAAIAGHYLMAMLVTGGLKMFQTYFDLESGTMSSTYILPRKVNALLKQEKE